MLAKAAQPPMREEGGSRLGACKPLSSWPPPPLVLTSNSGQHCESKNLHEQHLPCQPSSFLWEVPVWAPPSKLNDQPAPALRFGLHEFQEEQRLLREFLAQKWEEMITRSQQDIGQAQNKADVWQSHVTDALRGLTIQASEIAKSLHKMEQRCQRTEAAVAEAQKPSHFLCSEPSTVQADGELETRLTHMHKEQLQHLQYIGKILDHNTEQQKWASLVGTAGCGSTLHSDNSGNLAILEPKQVIRESHDHLSPDGRIPRSPRMCDKQSLQSRLTDAEGYKQLRGWCKEQAPRRLSVFSDDVDESKRSCLLIVERVSFALVLMYLVFAGVSVDIEMHCLRMGLAPQRLQVLFMLDAAFATAFVLEMLLRLSLLRWAFCKRERFWNIFDFLIVLVHVLDIFLEQVVNLTSLRALKLIRFLRAVRIARSMKTSRSLRLVLSSILSILKPLFWSMVALTFAVYLTAIFFVEVAEIQILQSEHERVIVSDSFQRFHLTAEAMWTFFLTVSGGISWQEVVEPFDNVSHMSRLIFVPCIALFSFGFPSLIGAIFVGSVLQFSTAKRDAMVRETMAQEASPLQNLRSILLMDKFSKAERFAA